MITYTLPHISFFSCFFLMLQNVFLLFCWVISHKYLLFAAIQNILCVLYQVCNFRDLKCNFLSLLRDIFFSLHWSLYYTSAMMHFFVYCYAILIRTYLINIIILILVVIADGVFFTYAYQTNILKRLGGQKVIHQVLPKLLYIFLAII